MGMRAANADDASRPKHSTGVSGRFVSGVSIPMSRMRSVLGFPLPVEKATSTVSPSTRWVTFPLASRGPLRIASTTEDPACGSAPRLPETWLAEFCVATPPGVGRAADALREPCSAPMFPVPDPCRTGPCAFTQPLNATAANSETSVAARWWFDRGFGPGYRLKTVDSVIPFPLGNFRTPRLNNTHRAWQDGLTKPGGNSRLRTSTAD